MTMKRNARIPFQMTPCLCRVYNDSYIVPCKKDKVGGTVWKPSNYRNLLLTTMEAFDLVDIQKVRHPQLRKYSYVSKALELKSRIDFFLVAQNLTRFVKKRVIFTRLRHRHVFVVEERNASWTRDLEI